MDAPPPAPEGPRLDPAAFEALRERMSRLAPARQRPERGALGYLTAARVRAAVGEVRTGRQVSLAAPVATERTPGSPDPARHPMTGATAGRMTGRGLEFARDRIEMNVHGDVDSHLDALCHVVYQGTLYGGRSAATLTDAGAGALAVTAAETGIVGRGVLLDIPAPRDVPWLEPGASSPVNPIAVL